MALTVWPKPQGTVTLREFVSYVKSHVDYYDDDSVIAAADMLRALGADKMLLVDAINNALLKQVEQFGDTLSISSQSLLLYGDPVFKVRAVVWRPPVLRAGTLEHDSHVYSYQFAHNHNFQLLTLGYLGPGYSTSIYECKPEEIQGYIGETVELRHLETTHLDPGKVMLYRTRRDVHIQLHAEQFSISLNFIVNDPAGRTADQFGFDMRDSTISSLITMPMAMQMSLLSFITLLGAKESLPTVMKMAHSDIPWRARAAAFECASVLEPDDAPALWRLAERDAHPQMRRVARNYLALL